MGKEDSDRNRTDHIRTNPQTRPWALIWRGLGSQFPRVLRDQGLFEAFGLKQKRMGKERTVTGRKDPSRSMNTARPGLVAQLKDAGCGSSKREIRRFRRFPNHGRFFFLDRFSICSGDSVVFPAPRARGRDVFLKVLFAAVEWDGTRAWAIHPQGWFWGIMLILGFFTMDDSFLRVYVFYSPASGFASSGLGTVHLTKGWMVLSLLEEPAGTTSMGRAEAASPSRRAAGTYCRVFPTIERLSFIFATFM